MADQSLRLRCLAGDIRQHGVHQHHRRTGGRHCVGSAAGDGADPACERRTLDSCRRHGDLLPPDSEVDDVHNVFDHDSSRDCCVQVGFTSGTLRNQCWSACVGSSIRLDRAETGGVISHKIHPSPLKLALPAVRLGGQPSLPWSPL